MWYNSFANLYGFSDSFLSFFLKIVWKFTIICHYFWPNSDDEGRVGIKRLITRNQFVPKAHEGSNPSLCAKKREASSFEGAFLLFRENINGIRTQWTKQHGALFCERWPKIFAKRYKRQNPKRWAKIKNESLSLRHKTRASSKEDAFCFMRNTIKGFERSEQNNPVSCFVNGDRRFLRNVS